jgi:hypothetical protein
MMEKPFSGEPLEKISKLRPFITPEEFDNNFSGFFMFIERCFSPV